MFALIRKSVHRATLFRSKKICTSTVATRSSIRRT